MFIAIVIIIRKSNHDRLDGLGNGRSLISCLDNEYDALVLFILKAQCKFIGFSFLFCDIGKLT